MNWFQTARPVATRTLTVEEVRDAYLAANPDDPAAGDNFSVWLENLFISGGSAFTGLERQGYARP